MTVLQDCEPLQRVMQAVADAGPVAYLLTVRPDGRPWSTSVAVRFEGGTLCMSPGRKSFGNACDRGQVSLLWPPAPGGCYSLIIDGEVVHSSTENGNAIAVRPTRAVLHPIADPGTGGPLAERNCQPIYRSKQAK